MADCSKECVIREVQYTVDGHVTSPFVVEKNTGQKKPAPAVLLSPPPSDDIEKHAGFAADAFLRRTMGSPPCNEGCHCVYVQGQKEPDWTKWQGPGNVDPNDEFPVPTDDPQGGPISWGMSTTIYYRSRGWKGLCSPFLHDPKVQPPVKPPEPPKITITQVSPGQRESDQKEEKPDPTR